MNVLDDNNDNQLIKSMLYVFKITSDTTLRWFQYRISHRILATNDFLYKIHIKDSNLCTLCNTETEQIMNLFVDCECVEIIWNMLENWLYDKCGFLLNYNKREILFGKIGNQFMAKNTKVLIAKYYIYKNRFKNRALYFENLKKEICIEKYISITNGNFSAFNKNGISVEAFLFDF